MFTYRMVSPDGDDLGEATYAQMIYPGEEIVARGSERSRVLALVPFEGENARLAGMLEIGPVLRGAAGETQG